MKRRTQWIPVLVLLLLPLLAACTGDFNADGWSGLGLQDDVLYVGTADGVLVALDVQDIQNRPPKLWSYTGDEEELGPIYGSPAIGGGRVFFTIYEEEDEGSKDGPRANVYAIDTQEALQGNVRPEWDDFVGGSVAAGPTLVGNILIVGASDGSISAYDTAGGRAERIWTFEAEDKIWSPASVSNGIVYFGSLDQKVYALSLSDGEKLWSVDVGGAVVGSPLLLNGSVFVGTLNRKFVALDAVTGEERWDFSSGDWFWASPISDGTTIYAATLGGTVYALNPVNGDTVRPKWEETVSGGIVARPLLVDDKLIVVTEDGVVHELRTSNGEAQRVETLEEGVRADFVVKDGVLILVDNKGIVRAIDLADEDEIWTALGED